MAFDGAFLAISDNMQAGWGLTVDRPGNASLIDHCGRVILDFHVESNNTAELLGVLYASRWVRLFAPNDAVVFNYDSEYARCMTCRVWLPSTNIELILRVRDEYDRIAHQVSWLKTASHTGDVHNERADRLAKAGAADRNLPVGG